MPDGFAGGVEPEQVIAVPSGVDQCLVFAELIPCEVCVTEFRGKRIGANLLAVAIQSENPVWRAREDCSV